MLLTIAIPTYNRAEKIANQINQIYASNVKSHSDVKVIVVDNASTDETESAILNLNTGNFIEYFKNEKNIGLVGNVIRCFELSATKYCWVVGDDDIVDFQVLESLLPTLRSGETDGVILNAGLKTNPDENWYPIPFPSNSKESQMKFIEKTFQTDSGLFMWISNQILKREYALLFYSHFKKAKDVLAAPLYVCMGCMHNQNFLFYDSRDIVNNNIDHTSWIKKGRIVAWVDQPLVYLTMLNNEIFSSLAREKLNQYYDNFRLRSLVGLLVRHGSINLILRLIEIHLARLTLPKGEKK